MTMIVSESTSVEFVADGVPPRLGVLRLAVTGAVAALFVFILCWVLAFLPFGNPSHAYLALFTTADPSSAAALAGGILWSLLFGALAGAVVAAVYNRLDRLDRRQG